MKLYTAKRLAMLGLLCSSMLALGPAFGDVPSPGEHPHYLHAVSDLQAADALLQMPDANQNVVNDQKRVEKAVRNAMGDCKHASWWDNGPTHYTPPTDANNTPGRLREINRLLHSALDNLQAPEGNPKAEAWQQKAVRHTTEAIGDLAQVLTDARLDGNAGLNRP